MLAELTKGDLFLGSDTPQLYANNLKRMPPDWLYRTKPVNYTLNKQGYRCPDWDRIKWTASNVVMGCSVVQGIGLDDQDALDRAMFRLTGVATHNLGVGGGSADLMLYNSLQLIEAGARPRAVVLVHPDLARVTIFEGNHMVQMGAWVSGKDMDWFRGWARGGNSDVHGRMAQKATVLAWQSVGVPIFTFEQRYLPGYVDQARDCNHPGSETIKLWAQHIVSKMY